jgi:hypothetical protein
MAKGAFRVGLAFTGLMAAGIWACSGVSTTDLGVTRHPDAANVLEASSGSTSGIDDAKAPGNDATADGTRDGDDARDARPGAEAGSASDGGKVSDAATADEPAFGVCSQVCANGCCDTTGKCRPGNNVKQCGGSGMPCVDCSSRVCLITEAPCCSSSGACGCAVVGAIGCN